DGHVTGVQTCALPILEHGAYVNLTVAPLTAAFPRLRIRARKRFTMPCFALTTLFASSATKISGDCHVGPRPVTKPQGVTARSAQIGRASCRERGESSG